MTNIIYALLVIMFNVVLGLILYRLWIIDTWFDLVRYLLLFCLNFVLLYGCKESIK